MFDRFCLFYFLILGFAPWKEHLLLTNNLVGHWNFWLKALKWQIRSRYKGSKYLDLSCVHFDPSVRRSFDLTTPILSQPSRHQLKVPLLQVGPTNKSRYQTVDDRLDCWEQNFCWVQKYKNHQNHLNAAALRLDLDPRCHWKSISKRRVGRSTKVLQSTANHSRPGHICHNLCARFHEAIRVQFFWYPWTLTKAWLVWGHVLLLWLAVFSVLSGFAAQQSARRQKNFWECLVHKRRMGLSEQLPTTRRSHMTWSNISVTSFACQEVMMRMSQRGPQQGDVLDSILSILEISLDKDNDHESAWRRCNGRCHKRNRFDD